MRRQQGQSAHVDDLRGWRAERLELAERALVEAVERGLRFLDDRLRGLEVLCALRLECLDLGFDRARGLLVLAARLDRRVDLREQFVFSSFVRFVNVHLYVGNTVALVARVRQSADHQIKRVSAALA
jgi:hypothetical protein